MDIEQERKAFEAAIPLAAGLKWYTSHGSYMAFAPAKNLHAKQANGEFAAWLKAKQHAAEMAKPIVEITYNSYHDEWGVYLEHGQCVCVRSINEDCKLWAHANGYRVIE